MLHIDRYINYKRQRYANDLLMPDATGDPLPVIRVVGWREEAPVRLLARQSLFGWDAVFRLRRVVALLGVHFPPVVRLSLLSVVYQEGQRGCETDDDQALEDAVVEFGVVVVVSAGHAFGEGFVVVVIRPVVVGMGLFEEVGDPFAEGPFFLGLCIVLGSDIHDIAS